MLSLAPDFDYGICTFSQMHLEENDPASAEELLDEALARRPDSLHLRRQRALTGLIGGDDIGETLRQFRAAAALGADDTAFHAGYGEALRESSFPFRRGTPGGGHRKNIAGEREPVRKIRFRRET